MPLFENTVSEGGLGVYGDGSDGAQTYDGTTTILGMAPSSTVYTLTRDVFLANGSALNTSTSIKTNGFRIFCSGTFTNNGTIFWNGLIGTVGGAGGAAITNANSSYHTATTGSAGGAGSTGGAAGVNGTNITHTAGYAGAGGNGGAGGSAGGGTGGTVTATWGTVQGQLRSTPTCVYGSLMDGTGAIKDVAGGAGGAGGGGDATTTGGGGGSGGGVVIIAARFINGTGNVQARGGNGAAGQSGGATGAGGGGGGGGGLVLVTSASVVVGSPSSIAGQTIDANGGALGAGASGGGNGVAGSNGTVILVPN
jgi:hypothetical protein